MKKLFTIAMMTFAAFAEGQVVLEHSYNTNWPMEVVNIEGDGYKYLGVDTATRAIKIYNTDHSLWKTINTSIPQGASIYISSSYASKYLFNADNKIELLVLYGVTTPTFAVKAELYNEDGTILNTFNNAVIYNVANVDNNWKLLVRIGTVPQHTDIYTLPGQWTGVSVLGKTTMPGNIYPNPVENNATINYSLPNGTNQGTINLYNDMGTLVRSYTVTSQFTELLISKDQLPAGVYFYDIITANGRQAGHNEGCALCDVAFTYACKYQAGSTICCLHYAA